MTSQPKADSVENISILQVVTFILSIDALLALVVQSTAPLTPEARTLLDRIDLYICLVFLFDFWSTSIGHPPSAFFSNGAD